MQIRYSKNTCREKDNVRIEGKRFENRAHARIGQGFETVYIDDSVVSNNVYRSQFVSNDSNFKKIKK